MVAMATSVTHSVSASDQTRQNVLVTLSILLGKKKQAKNQRGSVSVYFCSYFTQQPKGETPLSPVRGKLLCSSSDLFAALDSRDRTAAERSKSEQKRTHTPNFFLGVSKAHGPQTAFTAFFPSCVFSNVSHHLEAYSPHRVCPRPLLSPFCLHKTGFPFQNKTRLKESSW